ncbi:hypothetical protein [Puniceibacterium sp. IMCC21224]|uniref:hypothetical protein n=1 Tax=Puniceibacterium sp. IMCC21224 TaxID=1618204 RepID=UPI00065CEAEE|nr:hypothetical protein [Puniceibacterium sp. IMCC21224]KMK63853.1 hypothetical protein IMCC21224_173 [Puniceibacterium sp. IMCC21224]
MRANPDCTTARPSLPSAIHPDDTDILAGRPLRPGSERSMLSRFGDDVWDLSPAMFRANARPAAFRVDFAPSKTRASTARQGVYACPPSGASAQLPGPCGPSTAKGTLLFLRHFGEFLHDRIGSVELARVDQQVLDAYLAHLGQTAHVHRNRSASMSMSPSTSIILAHG